MPSNEENPGNRHPSPALAPDAKVEADNNLFAFTPGELSEIVHRKDLAAFHRFGGLRGLEKGLRTDLRNGLDTGETRLTSNARLSETEWSLHGESGEHITYKHARRGTREPEFCETFIDRKRVFSVNALPEPTQVLDFLLPLLFNIFQSVLLLLPFRQDFRFAMVIKRAVAITKSHKVAKAQNLKVRNNTWWVKVVRFGRCIAIPIQNIVVGDVVTLEPGDLVPADGVYIDGHGVKCSEHSVDVRKYPASLADEVFESQPNKWDIDPFIVSGTKVCEGVGRFLVTAVGVHSAYGRSSMAKEEIKKDHAIMVLLQAYSATCCNVFREILEITAVLWGSFGHLVPFVSMSCRRPRQRQWKKGAVLPVIVHGRKVNAIPDTGSDESVISTACASELGLIIRHDPDPVTFKLANGRFVKSQGVVRATVYFARGSNRTEAVAEPFKVFPNLAVPLILGRGFLKYTKTLSKYDDRLQMAWNLYERQPSIPRVFHLSAPKQRLRCYIDGVPVYANADTGAEMNLASRKWAEAHNVPIRKPDRGYERVMLADGSVARISGQFIGNFRVFGETDKNPGTNARTSQKDFFILDGLTSDVLLCQNLLLDIRVFKEQQRSFVELHDSDAFADLNLVSWLSKKEKRFLNVFKKDRPVPTSPYGAGPESCLERLHLENAREQDRHAQTVRDIATLPEAERTIQLADEETRYRNFIKDLASRLEQHQQQFAANASRPSSSVASAASTGT
ncbi:E1-E2 ATPase-domain-containing protein [Aspergillus oleicola]